MPDCRAIRWPSGNPAKAADSATGAHLVDAGAAGIVTGPQDWHQLEVDQIGGRWSRVVLCLRELERLRQDRRKEGAMRGFIFGVVMTMLVITGGVFAVSQFGLYPIGADSPR